jgi:hypothetical protein
MRLGGFLITSGALAIAMSVLVEGAALMRCLQDVPRLLLPLPDDSSLPVLIESRLELRAYVDGQPQPSPLVVAWSAHDGNGQLLQEGATTLTPGASTLLGRIPAGSRHELHVSAHLLGPVQPHQAYLEVRATEASAASLALAGAGLFVVGEGLLGVGVALSVWRWVSRLARPVLVRWRRFMRAHLRPRRKPRTSGQSRAKASASRGASADASAAQAATQPAAPAPALQEGSTPPADTGETSVPGGVPPQTSQVARPGEKPLAGRTPRAKAGR